MEKTTYKSVIALTGGIGCGKSSLAKILKAKGATVIDADKLAREVLRAGTREFNQVVKEFGADVLLETGELDRKALAKKVFGDEAQRKKLEQITHPAIRALALEAFQKAISKKCFPIIYDVPLFFEAGLDKLPFKAVIVVVADEALCIERLVSSGRLSREEAKARIAAQYPIEEKKQRADFVVDNSSTLAALEASAGVIYNELLGLSPTG